MRASRNRKWEFVEAGMTTSEREFIFAPRIPRGLGSAVEGLAREILRHRPEDIYGFAAHHFEELVKLREKVRDAAAGIVSTRTRDCDSPTRNVQQDRILDWDHSRTRKIVDFIEETATKESIVPAAATVSKLEKRRKEATTYRRSGWSINQTVVVLKRHECSSVDKTEKLDTNKQHPEERTPRSLRNTTRGQFVLRSLSAGDLPSKTTIECQLKDNREKFCNCVSGKYSTTDTTAGAGEGKGGENSGDATATTTLKRQSSADEIERRCCSSVDGSKHHRYVTDSRKTRSATNGKWKRNWMTTDDTEQRFRHAEKAVVQQLDLKAGQEEEEESKIIINQLSPTTLDCESRSDAFQDPNHGPPTVNGKITENPSLSIVLPSVVTRPSSSVNNNNSNGHDGYSKNGSRNHAYYDSREENNQSNDLILPPISSDVSKPIKKENTLTLPYLHTASTSKATEVEAGLKADALLETCNPGAVNSDYDSVSVRHATVDPNAKVEHETGEISALAHTDERDVLEELEMARHLNLPETDVDESFKDSLNVTPDSIEHDQRPDSLEHQKEKNSPIRTQVDDNEERMGKELECLRQSSELKNKLIEIETVEKSIENTLVSSRSGSPMPPASFRSFEAGESSSLLGNETGTRKQANSEQDARTINDSSQHAKLNEGQDTDVVDRPNVRAGTFDKPPEGIDLSCYVLTEGSPCEIPESVTTVIITDNILQRGDAALESDREAIENVDDDVASKPRTLLWNREMRQELGEGEEFPFAKGEEDDPFGEYVCPTAGIGYSTSVDLDFLGGKLNLGNIKEEEETEKQVSVLPADVVGHVDSCPSEKISSVHRIESDSLRTDSEPLRTCQDTKADEGVDTSSVECSKEHGETTPLNDCFRGSSSSSSLLDATGQPYVPELNLDSLRDVTIASSFERSDSRNNPHKSDKENDDDITIHEDGQTLSSIDTLSSGKKAIVDQPSPSNSQHLLDGEELSNVREEGQLTKIENEIGQCRDKVAGQDSPSTEEEIARELIENLTLEASILGEIPNTENAASLSIEFHPLVCETPSPVTIASVDVTSALCPETPTITTTTTSCQGEKTNLDFQVEGKEGSRCSPLSETTNGQLENDDSTASFLETACETRSNFDNIPEDQDQRDRSEIKANSCLEDTKEMHTDRRVENETPPGGNAATEAARKIQAWTREFVLGQRSSSTTADGHPKPTQHLLHQLSAQTEGTSEEYLGESPSSDDQRHEHLKDRGQRKALDASTTTTTRWSDVRQTGEFHDSLPLPLLEVPRSGTSSKDVSALTQAYKHYEPDAPTFAFGSPRASVLCSCTVHLSETLRLIGSGSDWSSPCSKLPFRVVLAGSDDGTRVPSFVRTIVNSVTDDDAGTTDASLVREPLALVDDETPKSILIEEILNSDEEKDFATRSLFDPEKHSSNRKA